MVENIKERVQRIHDKYTIVDAHFDLLMDVELKRRYGYRKVIETEFLPDFKKAGVDVIVCSLFIENEFLPEMGLKKALDQISALYSEIEESPDVIALCTSYDDIIKAKGEGKLALLLSFEGVDPLTNDLELLNIFYKLGVRLVGLTWSRRNFAADGCHFSKKNEGKKGGLTAFGVELVKRAEDMGMILDVSHLNDEGFQDVVKYTNKPFIASHSNSRSIHGSMRNLTDDQIKAIADRKGVIGINAIKNIAGVTDGEAPISKLADHIEYIVNLAGIHHVGYGFDLCNGYYSSELKFKFAPNNCDSLSSHAEAVLLTEELLRRGISKEDCKLIIGGNFFRTFNNILV